MSVQAAAPAQAPVAAKTKEEAIAMSRNMSSQQQAPQKAAPQAAAAAPQADRTPALPRNPPAPADPKELERRREGGQRSSPDVAHIVLEQAQQDFYAGWFLKI